MKKLFAFLILALAFAFAACGQTPAFKRSGTNLPFATTLSADHVIMVDRGAGQAPANVTYQNLSNQLRNELPFERPFAHSWASNVVTRGLNDNAAPTPDLVVSWWYIYAGIPGGKDWFTNLTFYTSNMVREFRTNGYYHAGWQTFSTDGGWAQEDRTAQGRITWNTNYFENARLGMSLPTWVRFMHTNGWKVMLYSSVTTNACDRPSSPINYAYRDIQDMMSWGVDGVKLDHCGPAAPNNITSETNEYYTAYYRIVNQAVNDYYAIVASTNGECRAFKILTTGSSGESFPNSLTTDMLFGVNQSQYQPYIVHADIVNVAPWNSAGVTNYLSVLREVQNFKPFFRRGHVVYNGIGVYGNNPGGGIGWTWTNFLAFSVLGSQPIEAGLGSVLGLFNAGVPPAGDQWADVFFPAASAYLTNREVLEMFMDANVAPAVQYYSNDLASVWMKRLGNGDLAVGIANESTSVKNLTVTHADFQGLPGLAYVVRNPWVSSNLFTFTNSFAWSQPAESIALLRFKPVIASTVTRSVVADEIILGGVPMGAVERATYPMKSLTIFGTGLSATTVAAQGIANNTEGLVQTAANSAAGFNVPVPDWAKTVHIVARYRSADAGTVAWTNHPYASYYYPGGRVQRDHANDPVNVPENAVVCAPGSYTTITNTIVFATTNAPKEIYVQMNASTNASARHVIGPLSISYER